jgi:hypothetical protein
MALTKWRTAMKHLAILTVALGALVTPVQAQNQKPVEFNGMVFDAPPAPGYEAPSATTTRPKTTHVRKVTHVRKHHRSPSAT